MCRLVTDWAGRGRQHQRRGDGRSGVGAIAGAVAGTVVAAVTVAATAVGPGGLPVMPPPDVRLPWLEVLAAPAVLVAVPMLALLGLARYRGPSAATGGRRP